MSFSLPQQPVSATQARGRMTGRPLQVTYRNGRAFAAPWHLSRLCRREQREVDAAPDASFCVDSGFAGRAVGIEITAPQACPLNA